MTAPLALRSPVNGSVVAIEVQPGQAVAAGTVLLLVESMKMEFPLEAPGHGQVLALSAAVGEAVHEGDLLVSLLPLAAAPEEAVAQSQPERPAQTRRDLQRLLDRRALLVDAARPEAMARRHATGLRSARQNLADLLDAGSFVEYGAFAVAAQHSRRSADDLQRNTPADGLVCGTGTVQGLAVAVLAYDYTVLAGTQGMNNHAKSDRVLELAARQKLPVVWFAEGGGGRPGDVDSPVVAGLHCTTFGRFAALAGVVPRIGIVAGYCFAGNAAILGCCDLIVAVQGASIGLGGPAMIEGGLQT